METTSKQLPDLGLLHQVGGAVAFLVERLEHFKDSIPTVVQMAIVKDGRTHAYNVDIDPETKAQVVRVMEPVSSEPDA